MAGRCRRVDDHGQGTCPPAVVHKWVAEAAFAEASSKTRLVIGKSFGCNALPWAIAHDVPGAWLTPVATDEPVRAALAVAGPEHLAIGGDRDEMWTPDAAGRTSATLITVTGADHAIESTMAGGRRLKCSSPCLSTLSLMPTSCRGAPRRTARSYPGTFWPTPRASPCRRPHRAHGPSRQTRTAEVPHRAGRASQRGAPG